jgi:hypothetical protein
MPDMKRSKPKGQASTSKVEIKLRKVAPLEPSSDRERAELVDNLEAMGCAGFYGKP